jgi:5-methylcytosine-specific restriction protein A
VDRVSTVDQIAANLRVFDGYRTSDDAQRQEFYRERLRLGKKLVVGEVDGSYAFAPSRFVGYEECTLERHVAFPYKHGTLTTQAITSILGAPQEDAALEARYITLCESVGVAPSHKQRAYWVLPAGLQAADVLRQGDTGFPDEVEHYLEGATTKVVVNAFERDPKARARCLEHFGYDCVVCGLNFERRYGAVGRRFIHVHHLRPISKSDGPRSVDPVEDLRPVCPNCHAMLHKSDPPFTVDELQQIRANTER